MLNRIQYDPRPDLIATDLYFRRHGVDLNIITQDTDLHGYSVTEIKNTMGNFQYVLSGGEAVVKPLLGKSDDVCVLVIQGSKEFGAKCPSESAGKSYIPGTKTVFLSCNADDQFYDAEPNFKIWLQHELLHALCTIARESGFNPIDSMDVLIDSEGNTHFYYLNQFPDDVNGNFVRTWESLYSTGFLKYD